MHEEPALHASPWTLPIASPPHLPEGDVHLWKMRLHGDANAARALLPGDEQQRAERLRFDPHRTRFALARAGLRRVLSLYDESVAARPFQYSPRGKPTLAHDALHFSISHAGDCAVFALARSPVGLDLEIVQPRPHDAALARRFFSDAARATLAAAPARERPLRFLEAWTQREAAVKALGLSVYDRTVPLPFAPAPYSVTRCQTEEHTWSLLQFAPWPNTIAALAVPGPVHNVRAADVPPLP